MPLLHRLVLDGLRLERLDGGERLPRRVKRLEHVEAVVLVLGRHDRHGHPVEQVVGEDDQPEQRRDALILASCLHHELRERAVEQGFLEDFGLRHGYGGDELGLVFLGLALRRDRLAKGSADDDTRALEMLVCLGVGILRFTLEERGVLVLLSSDLAAPVLGVLVEVVADRRLVLCLALVAGPDVMV